MLLTYSNCIIFGKKWIERNSKLCTVQYTHQTQRLDMCTPPKNFKKLPGLFKNSLCDRFNSIISIQLELQQTNPARVRPKIYIERLKWTRKYSQMSCSKKRSFVKSKLTAKNPPKSLDPPTHNSTFLLHCPIFIAGPSKKVDTRTWGQAFFHPKGCHKMSYCTVGPHKGHKSINKFCFRLINLAPLFPLPFFEGIRRGGIEKRDHINTFYGVSIHMEKRRKPTPTPF